MVGCEAAQRRPLLFLLQTPLTFDHVNPTPLRGRFSFNLRHGAARRDAVWVGELRFGMANPGFVRGGKFGCGAMWFGGVGCGLVKFCALIFRASVRFGRARSDVVRHGQSRWGRVR